MAAAITATATAGGGSPLTMTDRSVELNITGGFTPIGPVPSSWTAAGGAVGDFNRDGLPDLYFVGGAGTPDRLYINQGDGTFDEQAEDWALTLLHSGNGAAVGDFDSDGWLDIYVTSFGDLGDPGLTPGRNKLYRNNRGSGFANVATEANVAWVHPVHPAGHGAAWGDYNLDGHLDLHVALWWPSGAVPQKLFKNNGDGTFTDVSVSAGVNASIWGFQGAFADMNENGWPDLLIAADFGSSRYYRNNGNGSFTNITQQSGTGLDANGMGQTIADINGDGLLDWYVTSIYPSIHAPFDGNMLYINEGNHSYDEVSKDVGVHDGAWGWGAVAVDLDHDGRMDIVEVNGRPSQPWNTIPPRLFYQLPDGNFDEIAVPSGMFHLDEGRGVARLDADRDGRQDIVVMNFADPWRLYRNETEGVGNWIGISFDTSNNPLLAPDGFGTRITITAGGQTYLRYMYGEPAYLATGEHNVHFGLADAQMIDTITIAWPRGYVTTLHDVPVNQYMQITSPALADLNGNGSVGVGDLLLLLSKWGQVSSASDLCADLDNDGTIGVADLLILLNQWGS